MIQNTEDLLPLGSIGLQNGTKSIYGDAPVPSPHDTPDDFGDFSARVAETFDSVDLLIAARAEAEEAESRARANGETPLPFAKNGWKPKPAVDISGGTGGKLNGLLQSISTGAADYESPAQRNMADGLSSGDLAALSDASGVQTTLSARDFMGGIGAGADFDENAARVVIGGETRDLADMHIDELLRMTVESGASDLHLSVGLPPMVRKDGKLVPLPFEKADERSTQDRKSVV